MGFSACVSRFGVVCLEVRSSALILVSFLSSSLLDPQNKEVGQKLLIATLFMCTAPFVAYFASLHYVFADKQQPDSWAAGAAILVTNLVVAGYCYSAFTEDLDVEDDEKDNDRFQPRVGAFKQRTD